jgi:hypothetical protein
MEYELDFKPFVRKDGFKYKIIKITDIALHTTKKRPTLLLGKKIKKSFESKKPGRFYGSIEKTFSKQKMIILDEIKKNRDLIKMVQEESKNGYKVLISFPKEGIPIRPGKDTIEFINSKNGQRIIRVLDKKNSSGKM